MKDAHSRLAYGLAFAGALPFMAAIGLVALNWQADRAITLALTYGAVIIAFLSGIHWAVFLFRPVECPQNLFVISNVTALIGWFAIALPSWLCFLAQSACFLYLLMIDRSLVRADLLPDWFWKLRCRITSVVAVSLIVLAALTASRVLPWPCHGKDSYSTTAICASRIKTHPALRTARSAAGGISREP